jgi:hypothetical protein
VRIRTIAVLMTEPDHDKIMAGADISERRSERPRGRGSMKDFILEAALEEGRKAHSGALRCAREERWLNS